MISIAEFSPNPLRQGNQPICIPCSYACSVSPLVEINDVTLANECIVFQNSLATAPGGMASSLGLTNSASGYEFIEAVHNKSHYPSFVVARNTIELRRVGNDFQELENQLKGCRATAIIALSYPAAANRGPHSISIAYDLTHGFFIRDSAQPGGWLHYNLAVDARGLSVPEAIRNLDAMAIPGEAILFIEKQQQPTLPAP